LLLLGISTVMILGLSHAVAQAACADIVAGGNAYGDFDCRLINMCGGWCYYNCTCSNVFPGYTCDKVLTEAGFEIVEGGPQC
jgi:hypothetical protein